MPGFFGAEQAHTVRYRVLLCKAHSRCTIPYTCLDHGYISHDYFLTVLFGLLLSFRADVLALGGGYKSPSQIRCSFANAQKMRAAATYGFDRVCGLGSTPWQTDNFENPSISSQVSNYMYSLRRHKVCRFTFFQVYILINCMILFRGFL